MSHKVKSHKAKLHQAKLSQLQQVITKYKASHAINESIGLARLDTSEFMAESFGLSNIFGGRYGY